MGKEQGLVFCTNSVLLSPGFCIASALEVKICAYVVACTVGSVFFLQAVNNEALLCLDFMQLSA